MPRRCSQSQDFTFRGDKCAVLREYYSDHERHFLQEERSPVGRHVHTHDTSPQTFFIFCASQHMQTDRQALDIFFYYIFFFSPPFPSIRLCFRK